MCTQMEVKKKEQKKKKTNKNEKRHTREKENLLVSGYFIFQVEGNGYIRTESHSM